MTVVKYQKTENDCVDHIICDAADVAGLSATSHPVGSDAITRDTKLYYLWDGTTWNQVLSLG